MNRELLLSVRKPGRYVGGEFGSVKVSGYNDYRVAVCFPDLYEIGMSNQAIKILYREFNAIEGVSCERVFSPDTDFEKKLKENGLFLYTLESETALKEMDLLAISIGYELAATNILAVLESGGIPLFNNERKEEDPLVIAGGPSVTNPLPFGHFIDGVFIGEVEDSFDRTLKDLRDAKRSGKSRVELLAIIDADENMWTYRKHKEGRIAKKALWNNFGTRNLTNLPVSSISAVQDNGIIEIMRGCPNSCRFCHAGFYYRPYRQKKIDEIVEEADFLINSCGYNEITLSSLSSGDYSHLTSLIKALNKEYGERRISFSLPSLRINTFTLSLLEELSHSRKSGLTFAVETPEDSWQRSINKEIDKEKTIEILKEAKKLGWKVAKFYFMIGLPFSYKEKEEESIAEYIDSIQKKSGLRINVNVGTFIPKPHTPFQWAYQLTAEESFRKMVWLKTYFKQNRNVKLSYHTPFVSYLEGVISRGDERAGELILSAYRRGARLDAWTEYFNKDLWEEVFREADWDVEAETCRERDLNEKLPWSSIDIGVNNNFLKYEYRKAAGARITSRCKTVCNHNCGVCNDTVLPVDNTKEYINISINETEKDSKQEKNTDKYLFKYSKTGKAVYLSHINVMNIFQGAFQRCGIDIEYSKGYNPKPKLEFAHPLSLGIESEYEIFSAFLIDCSNDEKVIVKRLNEKLPEGIVVQTCKKLRPYIQGTKKHSLMSLYGGSQYALTVSGTMTADILYRDIENFFLEKGKEGIAEIKINKDEKSGEVLIINLPETGTKLSNIFHILKELYSMNTVNEQVRIKRMSMSIKTEAGLMDFYRSLR